MKQAVVISVDAMGGDHGPSVVVPACAKAFADLDRVRFLLHGDEVQIRAEMALVKLPDAVVEVRHTDRIVAMDEKPAQALRRAKGTSMWNAVDAVRKGDADVAVSAGNTGALMAVSMLVLRMSPGLKRPALVTSIPNARGFATFLDVGANINCDAERLVEFAIMGEAFHRAAHAVAKPKIGLLNVGAATMEGREEVQRAHQLLNSGEIDLDYRGFVEGRDIVSGKVDVIVTDGFTGNIALKALEGTVRFFGVSLRSALTSGRMGRLGAMLARPSLRQFSDRLNRPPAAQLLGLNGPVVKSHGAANVRDFAISLCAAIDVASSEVISYAEHNVRRSQPAG